MFITLGNKVTNSYLPWEEGASTSKSYFSFTLTFGLFHFCEEKYRPVNVSVLTNNYVPYVPLTVHVCWPLNNARILTAGGTWHCYKPWRYMPLVHLEEQSALCKYDTFASNSCHFIFHCLVSNRTNSCSFLHWSTINRSWKTPFFSLRHISKNIPSDLWTQCLLNWQLSMGLKMWLISQTIQWIKFFFVMLKVKFPFRATKENHNMRQMLSSL